jgi:acetyl-CoA carboxylase biotin carboxylase subunit
MAKLIVHADTREAALARARAALTAFTLSGPKNNLPFFTELLDNPVFTDGDYTTGIVARMR